MDEISDFGGDRELAGPISQHYKPPPAKKTSKKTSNGCSYDDMTTVYGGCGYGSDEGDY